MSKNNADNKEYYIAGLDAGIAQTCGNWHTTTDGYKRTCPPGTCKVKTGETCVCILPADAGETKEES